MIHEARRPTHVFAIDDVQVLLGDAVPRGELVHGVEVAVLALGVLFTFVGFLTGNNLPTVRIYELTLAEGLWAT